jgi:GT2 family glycosyltransferase
MLAVIIVNYNVKYFLEQCLLSVEKAMVGIDGEIIVVDNASTDGSREYLEVLFPNVRFVWLPENVGFAKGNNIGLQQTIAEYILYLNPDTIVPEDCFTICMDFMQKHPDAGALGVKMIDGSGQFLKESKRAYPSLMTSFFKLTGLSSVFPHSKWFANYHLGHLNENNNHEVDVLSGAFMFVQKVLLDKIKGFDESFFMYGEDIELSYQIKQLGFKNYYCSDTCIIHFKGESTKKGSLKYVQLFYKAMIIFVDKHYKEFTARVFGILLSFAIWIRATISFVGSLLRKFGLPIVETIAVTASFFFTLFFWVKWVRQDNYFFGSSIKWLFALFVGIFLTTNYYAGLYDSIQKKGRSFFAALISGGIILSLYSILPEERRFSRGIVVIGSLISLILTNIIRSFYRKKGWIHFEENHQKDTLIVANPFEYNRIFNLLSFTHKAEKVIGRIAIAEDQQPHLIVYKNIKKFIGLFPAKEIIFCEEGLSFKEIIYQTSHLPSNLRMRISAAGSSSIVGSDSSNNAGEIVAEITKYNLSQPFNIRMKRLIDVLVGSGILLFWPLLLFWVKNPFKLLYNALIVILGKKTWVGYCDIHNNIYPPIKPSIIGTNGFAIQQEKYSNYEYLKLDELYAIEYLPIMDIMLIKKGLKWLGN